MGIVISALHGLLNMFQWLQHVIAANWLTIGDGLVLWIPDSRNSVSFNFPRMYRVAPTHLPSDIQTWHWNICYLSWKIRLHTGYFQWHIWLPSLHATISHYLRGWKLLFYLTKAMQWPRNPTEKIQLLCFEWSPPWHFKTACWHHFCLKLLSRDFCPTNYPNHLFHLAGHCACQSVKQDINMSVGHVK